MGIIPTGGLRFLETKAEGKKCYTGLMWQDVIHFWFTETVPKQWFLHDEKFDAVIKKRFENTYWQVVKGETEHWRNDPKGRLAQIIVLDQFARQIFRDTPQAFLYDPLALCLAQEAVRQKIDARLSLAERQFLYMPYMHSESPLIHEQALKLFETLGNQEALDYEVEHKKIIDRFGRYPHRNSILGRHSTPEEIAFIKEHPGF